MKTKATMTVCAIAVTLVALYFLARDVEHRVNAWKAERAIGAQQEEASRRKLTSPECSMAISRAEALRHLYAAKPVLKVAVIKVVVKEGCGREATAAELGVVTGGSG